MEKKVATIKTQNITFPQEPLWKETIGILSRADTVEILTNPKALEGLLHFNSKGTRQRYGTAIATRFRRLGAETVSGLLDLAHTKVQVSTIEKIWRILFCQAEPIVAKIYLEMIWPREPGSLILRNEIKSYIESSFSQQSKKLNQRIMSCLTQSEFLMPQGKQELIVVGFPNLDEAIVISTYLFLAQTPRTIKISEIESLDYWKFLGYRKFDQVRVGFRTAEAKGLLMRYATVDHLEQITTRYPWSDLLDQMG